MDIFGVACIVFFIVSSLILAFVNGLSPKPDRDRLESTSYILFVTPMFMNMLALGVFLSIERKAGSMGWFVSAVNLIYFGSVFLLYKFGQIVSKNLVKAPNH
jgi:hypothetical protein